MVLIKVIQHMQVVLICHLKLQTERTEKLVYGSSVFWFQNVLKLTYMHTRIQKFPRVIPRTSGADPGLRVPTPSIGINVFVHSSSLWKNRVGWPNVDWILVACGRKTFPNQYTLLQIACVLPVTLRSRTIFSSTPSPEDLSEIFYKWRPTVISNAEELSLLHGNWRWVADNVTPCTIHTTTPLMHQLLTSGVVYRMSIVGA